MPGAININDMIKDTIKTVFDFLIMFHTFTKEIFFSFRSIHSIAFIPQVNRISNIKKEV